VIFPAQYCCEIHFEINLLEMNSFPTLLVRTQFNVIQPSTLKYSILHRLNCFVRTGVLFDYLSPCPVHIPSKSLFLSSHLIIIRSIHFSLSLSISSPLVLLFLSLDLKVFSLHFSLTVREKVSRFCRSGIISEESCLGGFDAPS